jgi:hypothetical protein
MEKDHIIYPSWFLKDDAFYQASSAIPTIPTNHSEEKSKIVMDDQSVVTDYFHKLQQS